MAVGLPPSAAEAAPVVLACEEEGSDRDPVVVKLDPETRTFIFDGEPMEVLSVTKGYVAAFAHGQVRRDGLG